MSEMLDPALLLRGYAMGVFPMADSREAPDVFWVEPRKRAIIPLDGFHASRSLLKRIRSNRFRVTLDQDFDAVVEGCADRDETWINAPIEQATRALHRAGHAHSIECWNENRELVGGLYGVRLGRAFFAESMFSKERDASKVALAWLVARLKVGHFHLLDCQFQTPHLASLGAREISRKAYSALLSEALGLGGDGDGASASAGAAGSTVGAPAAPPESSSDFGRLERLIEEVAAPAGAGSPPGQLIAQFLVQTS